MKACLKAKKMKGTHGKKKVKKWSTEERKDKPSSSLEEGTKEMRTWRSLNQEETDQCWKNLAERMEVEVQDKNNVENSKREAYRGSWNGCVCEEAKNTG